MRGNDRTGATGAADDGDTAVWVGLGLAEAAAGAQVGAAPLPEIMAGGRRLRRRRRTLVGAVALGSVVILAGGTMAGLHGASAGSGPVGTIAPAGSGTGGGTGGGPAPDTSAAPTATPSAAAVRDPFAPSRTVVAEGRTADGKEWKLWIALWPLARQDQAYQQAQAVWQERHAADPELTAPTEAFVQQYWQPQEDVTNTYFTVDGVRLGHDSQGSVRAPSAPAEPVDTVGSLSGGLVGHRGKDDTVAPLDVVMARLDPNMGRVTVTWTDGTTYEPPQVTVGDSPIRWIAVARPEGKTAKSWQVFDRNGVKMKGGDYVGFLK
ncbi:hypothetical protein [Kitasatospora sp. NPDC058218]|uniref:hypothetical protein n=1 Tax=Kitasatospora sp. NPDC058218 TaxID=3346385 RepID=UPI0036DB0DA7